MLQKSTVFFCKMLLKMNDKEAGVGTYFEKLSFTVTTS